MPAATASLVLRHQPVTFSRIFDRIAAFVRARRSVMIGFVRAIFLCATMVLGLFPALAADKAFKRDDLADSAIKLEAQIKNEAGPGAQTGASLRTHADAAFRRNDYRTRPSVLGPIAGATPGDAGNRGRLGKGLFQILPKR